MKNKIKHCIELFKENRYKWINEKMLKVDSEEVTQVIKKNHSLLLCTCESSGKTGHNSLCRHKLFFILFPFLESLDRKLNSLINEYEAGETIMKTEEGKNIAEQIINDLNKLKKWK